MTDCPGSCNTWWRNLTPEQQATSEHAPRPGDPVWCSTCKASLRRKFTDLDYQLAWLAFRADGHQPQAGEPSRHNGGQPSPSQAMDIVEELTGWLWDWEDAVRHELGLSASFHQGYLPEIRSKVIAWLTERFDRILELPFAEDFGREAAARHWELLGKNNARPPRHGLVNCPRCNHKLAWLDGRDGLQCGGCGRTMDAAEYGAEVDAARRDLERAS